MVKFSLNVHYEDWLTYSGRADRPGEPCYKAISNNQLLNLIILLLSLTFSQYFFLAFIFSSDPSISFTLAFPSSGNSYHVVAQVLISDLDCL